jgi:two-component system chemotaxis response regulator CheB
MPEMSGLDMLKRLMLLGKAKVIVVSSVGQTGSPQALEARRLGAVDVIAKPSGAMSLDLQAKKGHEIVQSLRRALQLDAAPGA